MKYRYFVRIVLFFASFASAQNAAAGYCLEEWACWEVRETNSGIEVWVTNQKPYVFTASIDLKTRNLKTESGQRSNRHTKSAVVGPNSALMLLRLLEVNPQRSTRYQDIFYWTPGAMDASHDDEVQYQAPFNAAKSYALVQGFGGNWSHSGASKYAVDFAMPVGTPIHAARGGDVVQVVSHHNKGGSSRRYAQYANYVVILHDDGTTGEYHHLMKDGAAVEVGEKVSTGQHIGYSGNTGFSSLPHLHFAIYKPRPMGDFESVPFKFADGVQTRHWWQRLLE